MKHYSNYSHAEIYTLLNTLASDSVSDQAYDKAYDLVAKIEEHDKYEYDAIYAAWYGNRYNEPYGC